MRGACHGRSGTRRRRRANPRGHVLDAGDASPASRSEAASIYPAVQNLLLAARSLGLGANLTTWHLMAEGEVKRVLGLPRNVQTYGLIPIGWPIGSFGPVRRRPVDEVIHRDNW